MSAANWSIDSNRTARSYRRSKNCVPDRRSAWIPKFSKSERARIEIGTIFRSIRTPRRVSHAHLLVWLICTHTRSPRGFNVCIQWSFLVLVFFFLFHLIHFFPFRQMIFFTCPYPIDHDESVRCLTENVIIHFSTVFSRCDLFSTIHSAYNQALAHSELINIPDCLCRFTDISYRFKMLRDLSENVTLK